MNFTITRAAIVACALMAFAGPARAQMQANSIVVYQVGDGVTTFSGPQSAPALLKQYNRSAANQAVPLDSIPVPVTGSARLVNSFSATTEGFISLAQDSTVLVFGGYDTSAGVSSIGTTSSSLVRRVVDTVGFAGNVGRAAATGAAFSANSLRSAAKSSANNFWSVGGNSGVYYFGYTSTLPATVVSTPSNNRVLHALNNNLYFTSATGSGSGLWKVVSQPTTVVTSGAALLVNTGTGSSPSGFSVNAAETIAYIADDRASNSAGGIYKWTLSGATWTVADTLKPATGVGARGIAVDWSGTYPIVYATTTDNKLIAWTDSSNFSNVFITLSTAPPGTAWRSVALAPKATCTPATLVATTMAKTCAANGSITLTASGGTGTLSYQWSGPSSFAATTQNISNLQPGTYTVIVSGGGCTATLSATVANNATVTATISVPRITSLCPGDSISMSGSFSPGNRYQWLMNNVVLAGDTLQVYKTGAAAAYRVIVFNGINCTDTSAATTITSNPKPANGFMKVTPDTLCAGDTIMLRVAGGAVRYFYLSTDCTIPLIFLTPVFRLRQIPLSPHSQRMTSRYFLKARKAAGIQQR